MFLKWFLPILDDDIKLTKARIMSRSLLALFLISLILFPVNTVLKSDFPLLPFSIGIFTLLLIFKYTGSFNIVGNSICLLLFLGLINLIPHSGGVFSEDFHFLFILPMLAFAILGKNSGLVWMGIIFVAVYYIFNLTEAKGEAYFRDQTLQFGIYYYTTMPILLTFIASILQYILVNENRNLVNKIKENEFDLKRKNAELLKKEAQLKESNKELERFAYVVSHDLKQPIKTISNFTGLLEKEISNEQEAHTPSHEYINFISQSADRMGNFVDELLSYARTTNSQHTFQWCCTDSIFEQITKDLHGQFANIEFSILKNQLPKMVASQIRIRQLFQNLVSNAIKFKKPDQRLILKIEFEEKEDEYIFHIQDNGIGIEQDCLLEIFTPFKKLCHKNEGSGIGLATCKQIVEMHKGKIWATSQKGKGTTFSFSLSKNLKQQQGTGI